MRPLRIHLRLGVPLAAVAICWFVSASSLPAQQPVVAVQVEFVQSKPENGEKKQSSRNGIEPSDVVVWLTPLDVQPAAGANSSKPVLQLVQQDKKFEPHVLVVQVGTMVQFPNKDHFFHNVFSLYDGKRFDLGFYEAGSSKSVRFDRLGTSFLFCNIHPEMSAAVIAVDTPYFAVSDREGRVTIRDVPDGRYLMHVWSERSLPENLKEMDRAVTISQAERTLAPIRLAENPNFALSHKNKYGQDYVPPSSTDYSHP
jgi:plastocyanin